MFTSCLDQSGSAIIQDLPGWIMDQSSRRTINIQIMILGNGGTFKKHIRSHSPKSANDVLESLVKGLPSILLLAREETGLARFPDWSLAEGIGDLISFKTCGFQRRCVQPNDFQRMHWSCQITYHLHVSWMNLFRKDRWSWRLLLTTIWSRQMKACPIRKVKLWFRNGPWKAMWISAVPRRWKSLWTKQTCRWWFLTCDFYRFLIFTLTWGDEIIHVYPI